MRCPFTAADTDTWGSSLKYSWGKCIPTKQDREADEARGRNSLSVKPDGVQLWGMKALCSAIQASRTLTSLNITNSKVGGSYEGHSTCCESDGPLFLAEALGNTK